jgi:DNA helicase II / ATP-dependent DNA helicase PcrA
MTHDKNHSSAPFDAFVETALNDAQRTAVTHTEGAILVVAGAGSGKTRVITARMTNLILHCHVHPEQIIALTFTNKAALEMKNRVAHFLPRGSRLPFVGTFHSYCVRILKQQRDNMVHKFAGILDADDQQKIIKNILQKNGLQKKIAPKQAMYQISQIKNHHIDPEKAFTNYSNPLIHELYRAYEHEKRLSHCLDFDDLLLETLKLCNNPKFTDQFQHSVRHVLVDEYQDTNIVQHALLKAFCLHEKKLGVDSLCAVGDEDQSIYSWRGATVQNIRNFIHDFPETTTVKIEQNYRSVQPVLDVANTVIQHNSGRTTKKLWSSKKGANRICSLGFASEYQEADAIAQLLLLIRQRESLSSVALLYRAHTQSRALEEALIKESIPYTIIGGTQFYDRMEIKDLLAYARLIVNPFDRVSCSRVINVPARKLGTKFEELFFDAWAHEPFDTFISISQTLIAKGVVTAARATALAAFVSVFDDLTPDSPPHSALETIIKRVQYKAYLKEAYEKDEAEERISNVDELLSACKHFENNGTSSIAQALEEIALVQDRSTHTDAKHDAVTLMTLHAAKGLEFDTVILTGLEEGLLPTSRATMSTEAIEEERRLLYVGITRACERLLFTRAKYRYTYGTMTGQTPSRFVAELPSALVAYHEVSFWRMHEIQTLFAQWLGYNAPIKNTSVNPAHLSP